ncbi:MAG: hypothetical protein ACI4MQ_01305 [Candidatus Coproplasma sp.]
MKNIVIDKEYLKGYKTLSIGLENCDVYKIDIKDILDVYCIAEKIGNSKKEYRTNDGFIKISARASQAVEYSVLRNHEIGTEWDHRLKERLEMCGGGADMTSFSLNGKRKGDIDICVPFNPLEDIIHGNEIELSNCPSLEIDNDGNMIIAFGEQSKQPKRKDNNYSELVAGWKDALGEFEPKVLKVKMFSLETFGVEERYIIAYSTIRNKSLKENSITLVFKDCKSINVETFFPQNGNCEIVMSKKADGRIYVGFDGLGIDFTCSSVLEYNYYCNRDNS